MQIHWEEFGGVRGLQIKSNMWTRNQLIFEKKLTNPTTNSYKQSNLCEMDNYGILEQKIFSTDVRLGSATAKNLPNIQGNFSVGGGVASKLSSGILEKITVADYKQSSAHTLDSVTKLNSGGSTVSQEKHNIIIPNNLERGLQFESLGFLVINYGHTLREWFVGDLIFGGFYSKFLLP